MNCRLVQRAISEYLDNELTGEQMLEVRHHLRECENCRREVESLRSVKKSLQQMKSIAPNADFEQRLFATVCNAKAEPRKRSFRPAIAIGVAASAAIIASALYFTRVQYVNEKGEIVRAGKPVAETVSVQDFESDQSAFASSDPFGGFAAPINVRNNEP